MKLNKLRKAAMTIEFIIVVSILVLIGCLGTAYVYSNYDTLVGKANKVEDSIIVKGDGTTVGGGSENGGDVVETLVNIQNEEYYFVKQGESLVSNNQSQDNTTAVTTIEVLRNGKLSFSYTVSSEENFDKFEVYKNDERILEQSGEVSNDLEIEVTVNDVVKFTYLKDGSQSNGSDWATITNLRFYYNNATYDVLTGEVYEDSVSGGENETPSTPDGDALTSSLETWSGSKTSFTFSQGMKWYEFLDANNNCIYDEYGNEIMFNVDDSNYVYYWFDKVKHYLSYDGTNGVTLNDEILEMEYKYNRITANLLIYRINETGGFSLIATYEIETYTMYNSIESEYSEFTHDETRCYYNGKRLYYIINDELSDVALEYPECFYNGWVLYYKETADVEMHKFKVLFDEVYYEGEFEKGMTWAEWCSSQYGYVFNSDKDIVIEIKNQVVVRQNTVIYELMQNGNSVNPTDIISENDYTVNANATVLLVLYLGNVVFKKYDNIPLGLTIQQAIEGGYLSGVFVSNDCVYVDEYIIYADPNFNWLLAPNKTLEVSYAIYLKKSETPEEPEDINGLSLSIDNETDYGDEKMYIQYEQGMTWATWVNSQYNTYGAYWDSDALVIPNFIENYYAVIIWESSGNPVSSWQEIDPENESYYCYLA